MYRKKTNSPNPNNLYKELVAEQNIDISSKNRLHMMLNDILSDESSNSYGVGYQYNYYPSLSVLNIQMDGTDVIYNFITPVRFQPNYYEIFGRNVIENLRANVRQWKLNPQVLHMAFSFTDILRIHDRTFLMFAQFLTQLSNNTEQLLNNSQALPEPTFPIYLSIQSVSLPRLTDNNSLLYPFPSINREENDCSFKLKGISVRLMEEGEVSLNTLFPTPQTGTYHRSINDCVRKFRNKMMNFIKDGFDQLEHLVNKYLKTYDYHFEDTKKYIGIKIDGFLVSQNALNIDNGAISRPIYEGLRSTNLINGQTNRYWCTTKQYRHAFNYHTAFSFRLYLNYDQLILYRSRDQVKLLELNKHLSSPRVQSAITSKISTFIHQRASVRTAYAQLVPKPLGPNFFPRIPDLPPLRLTMASISVLLVQKKQLVESTKPLEFTQSNKMEQNFIEMYTAIHKRAGYHE
ncbi:hypothetical protein SNEBB_006699 [Seison nebaliae]|nr:hypothetical protein SNEBB_006699 [Seison nebaliae]